MNNYYISFGQGHTHSFNGLTLDKDCLLLVQAESWEVARVAVIQLFGQKWSHVYDKATMPLVMESFPRGVVNVKNPQAL